MTKRDGTRVMWSNVSKKPKGFSPVKGEPFTYTYRVPITGRDDSKFFQPLEVDQIQIKQRMILSSDGYLEIDKEETNKSIEKEIGMDAFSQSESFFIRDSRSFPYINSIDIWIGSLPQFRHNMIMKRREKNIKKILGNIRRNE